MRQILLLATFALATGTARVAAQNATATPDGAATITAGDLVRHALVLAHDSMRNRAAPSPALERTARYIADQFRQAGLTPGGGDNSWLARYPVPGRSWLDKDRSRVMILLSRSKIVTETGQAPLYRVEAGFDTAAYFLPSTAVVPSEAGHGDRSTVLVAGRHTAASLRQLDLQDVEVLFVPPAGVDSAALAPVLEQLRAQSRGLVVLSAADSATFAARVQAARRVPLRRTDSYIRKVSTGSWAAEVWPAAIARALVMDGIDLVELRAATAPVVRQLPSMQIHLWTSADPVRSDTTTVPNVVGRLEGTDSRSAPLVVSAHMEHTGPRGGSADSVTDGTDRDASEVVGLLALAQAMTRSGLRPRRTVIFLASSGGGTGDDDWGSNLFISSSGRNWAPNVGSNLALERLRPPAGDTLFVSGTQDVTLPRPAAWVVGAHPELQLTLAEETAAGCPAAGCWPERSAFGRSWIPTLAVNSGHLLTGTSAAQLSDRDSVLLRNADREARTLRFAYHLIEDIAAARESLRMSAEGRRRRQNQSSEP